jgi:hypothetical protein
VVLAKPRQVEAKRLLDHARYGGLVRSELVDRAIEFGE